jgi:hypothetical protein
MQTDWNGLKTDVKGRQLLKTMEEAGFKWWPGPIMTINWSTAQEKRATGS